MSKRGRRRNSKRRKSSSSSKQSVSPYIFRRQNKSNSVTYKDDIVEKGETDSFGKENLLSGSEDDEKYNNAPSSETRFQQDYNVNSFPNQRSIYTKMTEDKEKGVRIVTSVSVNDMEDPSPKIMFQQSHEPLSKNLTDSSAQVTNIMNIYCNQSDVKFEIQEILQLTTSGINTTFVLTNNDKASTESFRKCEKTWIPNNESFEQPSPRVKNHNGKQNTHLFTGSFTFSRKCEQTESHNDSKYESLTNKVGNTSSSICCSDHKQLISTEFVLENHPSSPPTLSNVRPQEKINQLHKSISSSQFCDIPPPQEFADVTCNTLEDLTHDLASCGINYSPASKQQSEVNWTPQVTHKDSGSLFSVETEKRADLAPSFDELSHSANYDPVLKRPTLFTSSYKDFINFEKRKSCTRNNSIATVEHKVFLFPEKRRQTFPGSTEGLGLMQGDLMLPYTKSFYSLIMSLPPLQTERLQRIHQGICKFSAFGVRNSNSSQTKGSSEFVSGIQNSHEGKQSLLSPFYMATSEENHDDDTVNGQCTIQSRPQGNYLKHTSIYDDMEILNTSVYQNDEAANGVNQGIGEIQHINQEPLREDSSQRSFAIHVIPPSCSSSEEHMLQNNPVTPLHSDQVENDCQDDSVSFSSEHRKSSVTTITAGALEQRLMASGASPVQEMNIPSLNTNKMETKQCLENINDQQLVTASKVTEEGDKLAVIASCPAKGLMDAEIYTKELLSKTDKADKQLTSRSSLEAKEHLKPVILKEPDSSGSDHWAKRRKLFKESKQWSSAGGSSITSDITEESVSEETRSMDMSFQDIEDRGFYTETFHSSAWIYQGDDGDSGTLPSSLNTRTRAISIRERTVKISKGTGEYPWGFRIQFSKPIVVTEVDTNGAAEEAGLMVGDLLLAVNGTDVTSIPHSEAADLARQGPDILTLTIGSDIARCPNTPRPACRGYLHKRTQSGLIKGWRKRWFVLTHDCCLSYYRHKRDEGKRQALSAIKLEGAHVEKDVSLGKPFVFKCNPQSGNRVYFFCATSSQDMKRWLEAIGKAIHPITQNHVWMDVTRHNSNLPPLAVKNPECLGLLHKMDKNKEMWVQHYCILKDGCLSMYSGIRATHAHGGIYLQGYVVREQPYGSKKSAIELKPPSDEFKTFYLCAENSNENKRWIIALRASIKKWVPLHQALQDYMNLPSEETRM